MDLYSPVRPACAAIGRRNCAGVNENGRFPEEAPVWVLIEDPEVAENLWERACSRRGSVSRHQCWL